MNMEEQYRDPERIKSYLASTGRPDHEQTLLLLVGCSVAGIALRPAELATIHPAWRSHLRKIEREAEVLIIRTEPPEGGPGHFLVPEEVRNALVYLKARRASRWN